MKRFIILIPLLFLACSVSKKTNLKNQVNFTVLQFNDFYEISGIENGTAGGAARMSTLRTKLIQENPNLLTVLAGDFLSPSLIGTLVHDGEKIRGRQMIEALNEIGIDLVGFGNHEFDYDQSTLQKRLNESKFDWVSSNIYEIKNNQKARFKINNNGIENEIPTYRVYNYSSRNGTMVRVGIVSPCIDANKVKYVSYEDVFESTQRELENLKEKVDFIICLSHLNKEQDLKLGQRFPEINLILGGHEHENMLFDIGKTRMTKADANAKSAYVHRIQYDGKTKDYSLRSELVEINSSIPQDERILKIVNRWKDIENRIIRNLGFDPEEIIPGDVVHYKSSETSMRYVPSNFGEMICNAMIKTCNGCDAAILNSGSSRLEDDIKGTISQYDILKAFPYAGSVGEVELNGSVLIKILNVGLDNKGKGGYLQWAGISKLKEGSWLINGKSIEPDKSYKIMLNEYLMTGQERGLDFINKSNPELRNINFPNPKDSNNIRKDIRMVIIDYLKKGGR